VLRFYFRVLRRFPGVLYGAAGVVSTLTLLLATAVLAFNRTLAGHIVGWNGFSPVWAIVPIALVLVYGVAKANYEEARLLEATNRTLPTPAPITINNYGTVNLVGPNSAQLPASPRQETQTPPEAGR